ncbi:MAG: hypothetical protein P8X62_01320 [Flavobacteriaceae bacterium]
MNNIIQSNLKNLQKSKRILSSLSNDVLCNTSIPPYHSSIGSHIRHILDFYDCILKMDSNKQIDLTARSRNKMVESNCEIAVSYLNDIISRLKKFNMIMDETVEVIDDLGMGATKITYTLGALFAQANSHTIHHYAIINYIFEKLGIVLNDEDFGYNPTTPKETTVN